MNTLNEIFYWIGASVVGVIGFFVLWLLAEMLWAIVLTCSFFRCNLAVMREHGRKPKWRQLPSAFLNRWIDLVGYRNNGDNIVRMNGGHWKGLGDWAVYPNYDKGEVHP